MAFYLWMFPLLFIFHDMEEIIGLVPWIHFNETLVAQKAPTILKIHKGVTTEGFALAVFEEFILVLSMTFLAYFSQSRVFELIWLGGFVAFSLHLLLHIGQSILLRKYIPALITSILCFPIFTSRLRHRRHQSPLCSLAWEKVFRLACSQKRIKSPANLHCRGFIFILVLLSEQPSLGLEGLGRFFHRGV